VFSVSLAWTRPLIASRDPLSASGSPTSGHLSFSMTPECGIPHAAIAAQLARLRDLEVQAAREAEVVVAELDDQLGGAPGAEAAGPLYLEDALVDDEVAVAGGERLLLGRRRRSNEEQQQRGARGPPHAAGRYAIR
jgi:hypothetical protein